MSAPYYFNLLDPKYRIVADGGTTDNSPGLQAWANDICAFNGEGVVPYVPNYIGFSTPITFAPQSGATTCTIRIHGASGNMFSQNPVQFLYKPLQSSATASAWIYKNLVQSTIEGIGIRLGSQTSGIGCVAHDIQFTPTLNDGTSNQWINCLGTAPK